MQQPLTDVFFSSFDLHPDLLSGLEATGFTRCTPIQALTLPEALQGVDVAGQAQTGTGKTGAFLVAAFQRLLTRDALPERRTGDPRVLIVAPTRELAIQIHKDAMAIGRNTGLRMALAYGGTDYDKQRQALQDGIDVLIATPGRLIDYYKQGAVDFRGVEVVVIDEADRMFDLGFIKDIRYVLRRLPASDRRQGLLYSATLSHRVRELAYEHMNNPIELKVETDNVTADRVKQVVYFPAADEKKPLLLNLMKHLAVERTIVFVNTRHWVERVTEWLKRYGWRVGALSGDVPQKKRESLLRRFQAGEVDVLVATDVAARGLHIPAVSHVINYDLPQDAEDYVHRIGRTARLGAEGDAVSFACETYAVSLPDIEAYIGQSIPRGQIDPAWLAMPAAPPRSSLAGEVDADDADADDGSSAAHDRPPRRERDGRAGGGRGGRSGDGRGREGRGGGSRSGAPRGERRPRSAEPAGTGNVEATASAGEPVAVEATALPAAALAGASAGTPGKRRRRGGRNRRKGGENASGEAANAAAPAQTQAARGRHEPRPAGKRKDHEQAHRKESGLRSLVNRIRNLFRR
ncbi:MAG: DEAD/DEAH box helicase [Xanthomonadales bacterium]|nr:DEAD/DEAH box helicase [Xanthomonadales bacterium]